MALALTLWVVGCDQTPQTSAPAVSPPEQFSPADPKPLRLTVTVNPLPNGARIGGATNLPDGTKLMLDLRRGTVWTGESVAVQGGSFSAELYPRDKAAIPPGRYTAEVSTPLGDLQDANVQSQLGSSYEALTGPLLKRDQLGRVIDFETKVIIGGKPNPEADRAARKQAYRDNVEFSERSCRSNPGTVERLTGRAMSTTARERSIRRCLSEMAVERRKMTAQGLIEP